MEYAILFIFGIAIGSFMNVLALRYDGEHFLFNPKVIGGRSRCPHCMHTLRWFELIPVISFIIQGARCRSCQARIGFQYPLVELLSGVIFVLVPWHFASYPWLWDGGWYIFSGLWIAAFEILLLMAYIDLRLQIIPDELVVFLGIVAILETIFAGAYVDPGNPWMSHLLGAILGGGFFGSLVLATRGKGMGMGDVKLGVPLGFLFGWPDMLLLMAFGQEI